MLSIELVNTNFFCSLTRSFTMTSKNKIHWYTYIYDVYIYLVYGEVNFSGAIYFIFHLSMLLDWISTKRKTLDSIFVQQSKKAAKKFHKRKMNTHKQTRERVHTSHKYWYNLYEMCSMNFEPSDHFFPSLKFSAKKNWKTSMFTQELDGMVWISFNALYVVYSGKKNISLWVSFIMTCEKYAKKMTHTWRYFHHKLLLSVFSNFTWGNDKDRSVSTMYPKQVGYVWTI